MREFLYQKTGNQLLLLGHHKREFREWVATLEDTECFSAKFTRAGSQKTDAQRGFYYGVIIPDVITGLKELGWGEIGHTDFFGMRIPNAINMANVHLFLKAAYAIGVTCEIPSVARMSVEEMSHYIDKTLEYCRENNIYVRFPGEDYCKCDEPADNWPDW